MDGRTALEAPCDAKHGDSNRTMQMDVASSVKKEPPVAVKVKRERIDDRKAMDSNGDLR